MTAPLAKVLVVDDTPRNVKLLADLLSVKGYAVVTAASGPEGLDKVEAEPPDIVLLDVMMPGMSGYEVCRKIRENPRHRDPAGGDGDGARSGPGADQIWSLAGFDVEQDDSGDRRRMGRITRRGDPAFRKVLFAIGLNTSLYCPAITKARQHALKHGKRHVGAVIHASHKANRMCFYLLLHQVAYDPKLAL